MNKLHDNLEERSPSIAINGAGITGCTLALYLAKKGFEVSVFDKRKNLKNAYESKKRTVGMSISERGIFTLKDLNIFEEYKSKLVPIYGRSVHLKDGSNYFQEYGKNNEAIYSITRKELNSFLMDKCTETGRVNFVFNHNLNAVDFERKNILFQTGLKQKKIYNYDYLFGCDGVFSPVRTQMQNNNLIESAIEEMEYNFVEIYIPPKNGDYVLDPGYGHFWNAGELLLVAFPDDKNGFNGTLFYTKDSKFAGIKKREELINYIESNCHFLHYIDKDHFFKEFDKNPVSEIFNLNCSQWNYKNEVLVMGDAGHAMVPFYGMGMNTCMETVRLFMQLIQNLDNNIGKAIELFTPLRKTDTDSMNLMARINYNKLKKCHNEEFNLKWKREKELMEKQNSDYQTEYYQIAFTNKDFRNILGETAGTEDLSMAG